MILLPSQNTAAAAFTPLDKIQIAIAYEATGDQTVMTIQGILPEGTPLPTQTSLIVPEYFKLAKASPLVGAHSIEVGEVDHEIEVIETGNRYLFDIPEGEGIVTLFTFSGTPFMTLSDGTLVVGLEIVAPSDLSEIEFAFIAPDGRIGTGDGVKLLGNDAVGNEAYGVVLADVKEGELATAIVEFPPNNDQSTFDAAIATITNWFGNPFYLVLSIISIVLIGLLLWLLMMLRSQHGSHAQKPSTDEPGAEALVAGDKIDGSPLTGYDRIDEGETGSSYSVG